MKARKQKSVIVGGLAAAFLWASNAAAETWDMPTPYPDGNFHTQNVRQFADDVKRLSGGKLEIRVHSAASLFKITEIKRAVRDGSVNIGEILMSVHANENPIFGVDGVPFLAAGFENAKKLWKAQKPFVDAALEKEGIKDLYTVPWPGQGIYAQREIASLDDMQGVKFRSYNAATARFAELMGAVPTQVQYAEVAQAFSTGVVGAMVSSAQSGVDLKSWDFLTVFYDTEAMHPKNMVIVNQSAFDALEPDVQKALTEAARLAEERGWKRSREIGGETVATLKEHGILIPEPSPALVEGMQKIGETMISEWLSSAGDDGKELKDSYDAM